MSAPDDIPLRPGSVDLVAALSIARDMPFEALELAVERPDWIAPAVVAVVQRAAAGSELTEREINLTFWGVFVLAQARDTRLYRPLLQLLRRDEMELAEMFGDHFVDDVPRLVASVFDGDDQPIREVLEHQAAGEGIRIGLFGTLAFLTWDGRIPLETTRAYLQRYDLARPIRSGDAGWHGWEAAIALLGLVDLAPLAEQAHADLRLLGDLAGPGWCTKGAVDAAARFEDPERFEREGLGYVQDAIDELSDTLAADEDPDGPVPAPEPVRNPLRSVGRNDPCPCGSGRKFKACCLQAA